MLSYQRLKLRPAKAAFIVRPPQRGRIAALLFQVGAWRSLVAHLTGGQGVVGSNPAAPTIFLKLLKELEHDAINLNRHFALGFSCCRMMSRKTGFPFFASCSSVAAMANLLTLTRMLLIVPFAALFMADAPWTMKAALAIFIIAAVTDFFDGRIARARGEVSALGAALDPIADKLLIAAALLLLTRNGVIAGAGVIAALMILLREILVTGLREALARIGAALPVTRLAKSKTAAQIVAIGLLLASAPGGLAGEGWRPAANGALWLAAVLTFWTGATYAAAARTALRERGR